MSCTSLVKTLSGICHGKDGLVQSRALTVPDDQLCLAMPCCPCWHQDLSGHAGISWGKGSPVQTPILSEMNQSAATLVV